MKLNKYSNRIGSIIRSMIPGIIVAAVVFGPSKMTITAKIGASYGYELLWIVPVALFFMAVFTDMGSRIGLQSEQSLLTLIRGKFGKLIAILIGVGIFMVTASFQAGNSIGVGISIGEPTHTESWIWILLFNLIGIFLLFFNSFYHILERLMLVLVGLMLISFVVTFFLAKPDWAAIGLGFTPSVPKASTGLIIAFFASCFSIVGAFYQSYLVQERKRVGGEKVKDASLTGIILLGVMSLVVMICGAAILHSSGVEVKSAMDMASVLEPLFGRYASFVFLAGLFAASFSSVVGNAAVGGTLLADALGYDRGLEGRASRVCIAVVMVVGATVAISYGGLPLELIVLAQSLTIFLVPFIGYAMFRIASDQQLLHESAIKGLRSYIAWLGLLILTLLAGYNFYHLFIK